ncbi:MAG: efflux RND transporter periplasmic adaptor subunit [Phycisphaerales bacterium]|jgi:RND family efflux transporter MFP subunit|nr:efflux RND transporter periplasmic adaptor subunit [Phycisphaerales bacterium]
MFRYLSLLVTVLLLCSAAALRPSDGFDAIAAPEHDLDLGFVIRGEVKSVSVEPGDQVKKGDVLISLIDDAIVAQEKLQRIRSESSLEIDASKAEFDLAVMEEDKAQRAFDKHAINELELQRAKTNTVRKRLAWQLFVQRKEEAVAQHQQIFAQLEQHHLAAPIDGTVELVNVDIGELVADVRPVLRLVTIDPLIVDAPIPMTVANTLQVSNAATIEFPQLVGSPSLQGTIEHVASVADPGSETQLVRIRVPNPDGLPGGSHVIVTFE